MVRIAPPPATAAGPAAASDPLIQVAHTSIAAGSDLSNGTDLIATHESQFELSGSCRDLAFAYDGFLHNEFWPKCPNDYFVKLAVKVVTTTGTSFIPVTWPSGQTFLHVQPGSLPVTSVPLEREFLVAAPAPAGEIPTSTLTLRIVVWVDQTGKKWPTRKHGLSTDRTAIGVDQLTDNVAIGTAGGEIPTPSVIVGRHIGEPRPSVAVNGDSIGLTLPDIIRTAVPGVPVTDLSVQSERGAYMWSAPAGFAPRLALGRFSWTQFYEYNTNDGIQVGGDTTPTMKINALTFARQRGHLGLITYPTTLLPASTSNDGFQTVSGQAPATDGFYAQYQTSRIAYNEWLRDGSPVDPDTLAPLAIGASGLRAGQAGHPFGYEACPAFPGADHAGYVECADTIESARNSKVWKAAIGGQPLTGDGLHPSGAAAPLRATAFSAAPLR